jgi:hypothetical protein
MSDVVHKDRDNDASAAPEAKRKPARFGPVFAVNADNLRVVVESAPDGGAPPGAVDLRRLNYRPEDTESWGKGVRIMEVVASFDASEEFILQVVRKAFDRDVWPLQDKAADLDKRVTLMDLENAALKSENASLKRDIAMLDRRLTLTLERQAASVGRSRPKGGRGKKAAANGRSFPPGSPDAAQLPDSIIRRAANSS